MSDVAATTACASLTLRPIGVIHTALQQTPRLPDRAPGSETPRRQHAQPFQPDPEFGRVEVFDEFASGLADVEGFAYLYLLFWLHLSRPPQNLAPFISAPRGIFATHAPSRPNPLGLTIVRLVERQGPVLVVAGVDMLDGTPLLDIKPYIERVGVTGDQSAGGGA
ncbi:MAG: tRNA (N6-threonylcarbamoyladenosine(37)-N6)-methyltransferase TrmO [Thermoleophilia bacterium]